MKIPEIKIKPKVLGWMMMVINIIIFIGALLFLLFLVVSATEYGFLVILPSSILAIIFILISILIFYPSYCYLKNRPFKQNKNIGIVLIVVALYNLVQKTSLVIRMEGGGEGQIVIAGVIAMYMILFGIGLLNNYKKGE